MTLFRQIALLISLVFIALLSAMTWNDFRHSSKFIQGQMQTAAQDMANTMGIGIASLGQGADPAVVETFFNASFDSGYLSRIELRSPEGESIFSKQQNIDIRDVPDWFIRLMPIKPATGQSQVMQNWMRLGTLTITVHPGYAYADMYSGFKAMLFWFAVISGIGLVAMWGFLHLILQPLRAVEEQAEAIQENRFIQQPSLPKTRELRRVVEAMNRMVGKVRTVFADQAESINRYHTMLYRDELTGLGNRRQLLAEIEELCQDETAQRGCLLVIHFHGLEGLAKQYGYKKTDELIVSLARLLERSVGKKARQYCARINKSELASYIPGDVGACSIVAEQILESFREILNANKSEEDAAWLCAGIAEVLPESSVGSLLSTVDFALTQAKTAGEYSIFHKAESDLTLPQGKMEWRSWLEDSLAQHRFFLVAQPIHDRNGKVAHREVFVRLRNEQGHTIPAGVFMPVADALGIDFSIELEVFRMVLALRGEAASAPVSVNISSTFLVDAEALASLELFMREHAEASSTMLQIEASHFTLAQHPHPAEAIAERARKIGCRFGIDNLDLSLSLDLLQVLRPHFVKINARTLTDMMKEPGAPGLQALRSLTNGLDIELMAVGIETEEVHDAMLKAGVDALQGHHIGKPEKLT